MRSLFLLNLGLASFLVLAAVEAPPNIRYKKGKDIDFEELLIQGSLKRPEMTVVTGDVKDTTDGLLRLRENFLDRLAADNGEEVR